MLAKEMWIRVPEAFPNGLDALEVRTWICRDGIRSWF
jgi:hypothetical protein